MGTFSGGPQDLHAFTLGLCVKVVGAPWRCAGLLPRQRIIARQLERLGLGRLGARVHDSEQRGKRLLGVDAVKTRCV